MIAENCGARGDRSHLHPNSKDMAIGLPRASASSWMGRLVACGKEMGGRLYSSHSLLSGAVAAAVSIGMWQAGAWQVLEQQGYNALFHMRASGIFGNTIWEENIAIVGIDNASLKKYGKFPWSRDRYVQLLQALEVSRPAVIGFDLLFVDPSDRDAELARAIAKAGNVVLASAWDDRGRPIEPLPELKKSAAAVGQIFHNPDNDGISRRAAIFAHTMPSLGLAMLQAYNSRDNNRQQATPSLSKTPSLKSQVQIPQLEAGKKQQSIWINWPARTQSLPTYSFADVVEGKVAKDALAGKLVLVGVTATGFDQLRSPLNQNPATTGVYLHAATIDNLLGSRQLNPLDEPRIIVLLVAISIATSLVWSSTGIRVRLAIALGLPVIIVAIALCFFIFSHRWVPIAAPIGTLLLVGFGVQLGDCCEKFREKHEKQQLMSLFEKYLAPETAHLIWERKTDFFQDGELQAQEQVATVLFMDIRGFTSISETMTPRELFSWLNQYLDAMTECIMDSGGVVDKYIGDAIMAIFGVPFVRTTRQEIQQDAMNAIAASMAMHKCLKQLNARLKAQGKPLIKIGIGIHTGQVMAGSLGGSRRLNYSVVGDTVNVAARLESMNKEVTSGNPYNLLVSAKTFDYVRDRYRGEPVKTIQLRGRQQPTTIYSISGTRNK